MNNKTFRLDGSSLTLEQVRSMVSDPTITILIDPKALVKLTKTKKFLEQQRSKEIIYGINTGFGPMASHVLGKGQLLELQKNLIRSHAVGMGEIISSELVLASMIVRLNTLTKGYSGVSETLINHLTLLINKRITPIIPEHGAVGTSGDLVQLSHIALAIMGEGEVEYNGKRQRTQAVYKKLGIKPYELQPKEGLALINGTSVMSGVGSLVTTDANRLFSLAVQLGALALELVEAYSDSIAPELHQLRPHPGQIFVAKQLRETLASSKLLKSRKHHTASINLQDDVQELPEAIQEVYSLRCIAQILGPIYETLQKTNRQIGIEINSVTDNPIIHTESSTFFHGGNFHGDYVAAALDELKAAIIKMTMLSERRTNFFLHHKINLRFPPFLNLKKPGLTLGLQGLQFVATSTTAHSQSLAFPHRLHSIPTNGDNQDVVSMGTDAALFARKVIENAYIVLGIELVSLCQAVDAISIQNKLSKNSQNLYKQTRALVPAIVEDRELYSQLDTLLNALKHDMPLNIAL